MVRKRIASVLAAFLTYAAPALGNESATQTTPNAGATITTPQTPPADKTPNVESLGDPTKFCPYEKPQEQKQQEKPPVPMC